MKTILAYGDSLTYGANPVTGGPRLAYDDRWPTVLERGLGGQARVVAEGLGGRTTIHDDWMANSDRNGARILPTLLESHSPLDLVIILLGTNDLKPFLGGNALEAANGVRRLVHITRGHYAQKDEPQPGIVIVSPPHLCDTDHPEMLLHFGGRGVIEQSRQMAALYRARAEELGVGYFDAATVAQPDARDGVHLDAANTRAIGEGLVPVVRQMLGL